MQNQRGKKGRVLQKMGRIALKEKDGYGLNRSYCKRRKHVRLSHSVTKSKRGEERGTKLQQERENIVKSSECVVAEKEG